MVAAVEVTVSTTRNSGTSVAFVHLLRLVFLLLLFHHLSNLCVHRVLISISSPRCFLRCTLWCWLRWRRWWAQAQLHGRGGGCLVEVLRLLIGFGFAHGSLLCHFQLISLYLLHLHLGVLLLSIFEGSPGRRLTSHLPWVVVEACWCGTSLCQHTLRGEVVIEPSLLLSLIRRMKIGALGIQLAMPLQKEDTSSISGCVESLDGIGTC